MAKKLVIIESPTKAHTIQSCLGRGYTVIASKGHVRDLPVSSLGIDIENGFAPHYINIRGKSGIINELRREAKEADAVYLATDPDREGESISWHLAGVLGLPEEKINRVTFNELTEKTIRKSVANPRPIDMNLVDAQQSRRILDRIVGYKLSPMLWKRVRNGLSAGRVQSVATRLVVEREKEIRSFVPEEYWTVYAVTEAGGASFRVKYYGTASGAKVRLSSEKEADAVTDAVRGGSLTVKSLKRGRRMRQPSPPFTTSTMQQEAASRLGFRSARIMKTAQELYEGIALGEAGTRGLITYMRTDSLRVSDEACAAAREFISASYGEKYLPAKPPVYKSGSANVQDAHEAIRPADVSLVPADIKKYLTSDQYRLYRLIWNRFVSSQMAPAVLDTVSVDLTAGDCLFRAAGYTVVFKGHTVLYSEEQEESAGGADGDEVRNIRIPALKEGDVLQVSGAEAEQHFTQAPLRYTEATLIRELEEKGIGRPSTITPTITTIISRDYVARDGKFLAPTELGEITTRLMIEDFPDIVDYGFTAEMETRLDEVACGRTGMETVLNDFWSGFKLELQAEEEKMKEETKEGSAKKYGRVEETDMVCEKCGARMIVRKSKFGRFAACPNYPKCRNTKPLADVKPEDAHAPSPTGEKCPECGADLVMRKGPYGTFAACSNFPKCRYIKKEERALDVPCPSCGGRILVRQSRKGRTFYSCERYPDCSFSSWDMPTAEICPECGSMPFRRSGRRAGLYCGSEGCSYSLPDSPARESADVPELPPEEPVPEMPADMEMPPVPDDSEAPPEEPETGRI